ncbi:predicted transcriptional regulator [uncultured Mediterranean phage uvMED]|nr:putative transcriptional regulator [uncultured Mediterranean phage uvMED]BAQ87491.1 predicted transcriptional regulator [uncultured Mediterranean phage uvMED]BAR17161.1 predicted transcriptional regulator [uncultured Mediterranean phage uvMED]BAR17222.1 predicted transcriptional regulator [uncultured Mediterranean phage uvMED]BAR17295.1 predicted transcriptional regulator [uncultured Mediterranean phage uvMED]
MGRSAINLEDFKNVPHHHSKMLYKIAKDKGLTVTQLTYEVDLSYTFVLQILKGIQNMSPKTASRIRKKYNFPIYG